MPRSNRLTCAAGCISIAVTLLGMACDQSAPRARPPAPASNPAVTTSAPAPVPETPTAVASAVSQPVLSTGPATSEPSLAQLPPEAARRVEAVREVARARPGASDPLVELGMIYLANGLPSEAIEYLERALEKIPNSAKCWYLIGVARAHEDDPTAAAAAFQKSGQLDKAHVYSHLRRGALLMEREPAAALAEFQKAAALAPYSGYIQVQIAAAMEKSGNAGASVAAYAKALELEPKMAAAHAGFARAARAAGREADAAIHEKQAAEGHTPCPVADPFLAEMVRVARPGDPKRQQAMELAAAGRTDEAAAILRREIEADPWKISTVRALGSVFVMQHRPDEAIEVFRSVLRVAPGDVQAVAEYFQALIAAGRTDEAESGLREALRTFPGDPRLVQLQAELLSQTNRVEESITLTQDLARKDKATSTCAKLVELLIRAGRLNEAGKEIDALLKDDALVKDPDAHWVGLFLRGSLKSNKGDPDGAQADFEAAIREHPSANEAYIELTGLFVSKRDFAAAVRTIRDGLEKSPDAPVLNNALAWLLATAPDGTVRDGQKALDSASKACSATGNRVPEYLDSLAASYAELGQFDEAVRNSREAVRLAEKSGQKATAADYATRLSLYEQRKPFHEK